ncbi:MAG: FAD:protein FMN transferase [Bacteroidales bacterium]|nr:FAD:protein FMN transferase [Bacteroidales bacterium]
MKRGFFLLITALLCLSCSRDRYIAVSGYAQGGTYTVKLNLKGVETSPAVIQASIDSILLVIDNTLSGYNRNSVLSRYNAGEDVNLTPMFRDILALSQSLKEETGGAFDVGAAPLFDVWGFGFTRDSLPEPERIAEAIAANGSKLNFNAIAQGYSCDVVADYLHGIGVTDMLVDIGEIFCEGRNPSGRNWTIGIDSPVDGNETPGETLQGVHMCSFEPQGIVTSGNYRKFYEKDGRKYAHTIDPRTGYPVEHNLLSATIKAPTAALADAYATYCMVIGLEEARAFILSRPDLEGFLVYDSGIGMETWASDGFQVTSR